MHLIPKRLRKMMCMYNDDGVDNIKWEDTCEFTLPVKGGKVIKVYDADTITIASKLPLKNESPMKGKGVTEEEKTAAHAAQEFVSNLILHKYVTLKNVANEKYGRILADVYIDNIHLNELLLKEHYAVPYDGGTKKRPNSWLKYKITGEME